MKQRDEILELSFEFALMIIEFSELLKERIRCVIAGQLLSKIISTSKLNLKKP